MIMMICDICGKEIKKHEKSHTRPGATTHFHDECVLLCSEIVNNPKLKEVKLVYLNEYKEFKEQGKV
jgi:hypothetical protein